jgi:hypothetical protein
MTDNDYLQEWMDEGQAANMLRVAKECCHTPSEPLNQSQYNYIANIIKKRGVGYLVGKIAERLKADEKR